MTVMPPRFALDHALSTPLVEQLVNAIQTRIDERSLRQGSRMPSIRALASTHNISRFTVVTAYDRLVAMGYLASRQGSGFYVASRKSAAKSHNSPVQLDAASDSLWLLRNALAQPATQAIPGAGWLPTGWFDEASIQRNLRQLSRLHGSFLTSYGQPAGYAPLRHWLQHRLDDIGISAEPAQILLTRSATHALDLITRLLIQPGDTVLVDDPGYFLLFGALKSLNAHIVGVPWDQHGPNIAQLENLLAEHKPKAYFINSVLHNPTGASISHATAHRVLQLAERHDFLIIEDDIYGDFHPGTPARLAALDQLQRVIYLSSYSKTISASLRVGYIACQRELAQRLTDLKLLTGMTSSEIDERLIHQMLIDGHYRKHLDKTRKRLQQGLEQAIPRFEQLNMPLHVEPEGGMFIWTQVPDAVNVVELASQAASQGITLAPGNLFRPHNEPTPWLRFNVASSHDAALHDFLSVTIGK